MREMNNTGIEWCPSIPMNWEMRRVKELFYISKEKAGIQNPTVLKLARSGIQVKDVTVNEGQMAESYDDYNPVHIGDLLLNPMDLYSGANCNVSEVEGVISPAYVNLRAKAQLNPYYFDYYFKVQYWAMAMFAHGKGVSYDNRWTINAEGVKNYEVPFPAVEEQNAIVDVIQRKCTQIDTLIANSEQQIEKLKAYKQSVITETVTKGLDPDAEMKDSGIEWIGIIPETWRLSHIGNLAQIGSGGTPNRNNPEYWKDGTIPWMSSGEINLEYVNDTAEKITELGMMNSNAKLLPVHTVMLGLIGQGKTKGLTAILNIECTCNQNLAYLIPNKFLYYKYLFYCFKSMYVFIRGIVGESQAGIYQGFLKKQYIPLPSFEEQEQICDYLDERCEKIDRLIAIKQQKIEKLQQYKKSLIYEYVTGKKEVS